MPDHPTDRTDAERLARGRAKQRRYWNAHPEARAAHAAVLARDRAANPERARARAAVRNAIMTGELVRGPCHCGVTPTHGHHPNGYTDGHELDVVWLCSLHHVRAHRVAS